MIVTDRHTVSQAQHIARAAWTTREAEPVAAFRRWTLASLLLKRAHQRTQRAGA